MAFLALWELWTAACLMVVSALGQRRAFRQGPGFRGAFGGLRRLQPCNFQEAAGGADYLAGLRIQSRMEFAVTAHLYGRNLAKGMALISLCLGWDMEASRGEEVPGEVSRAPGPDTGGCV